jgi:transposase
MGREDLERLSKPELVELVLKLQRPAKTSRTSSKPPSTDRKERREQSRPGGAKPGHEGHKRVLSPDPDAVIDHRPRGCPDCGLALSDELPAEVVSVHEEVDIPPVKPRVEQHRRLSVCCPGCGTRAVAERPAGAGATPFGPRLHALVLYLKTFQALSYERLEGAMKDLFGLTVSQGGLMNMLRRAEAQFTGGRDTALAALHRAKVVACDETGIRIEGTNSFHWVFRCAEAVVHHVAPTRAAAVVRDIMGDHRPDVWLSDRYSAQQGHGKAHQTCLAHLARDAVYALEGRDEALALGLKLWLGSAFALAKAVTTLAASTIASKRRALERRLDDLLATATACDLTRAVQDKIRRARDQLLTFTLFPGQVEPTNNACERDLRPAVIQRKVTNGYRSTWSAEGEAAVRTVVSTERINHGPGTFATLLQTVSA